MIWFGLTRNIKQDYHKHWRTFIFPTYNKKQLSGSRLGFFMHTQNTPKSIPTPLPCKEDAARWSPRFLLPSATPAFSLLLPPRTLQSSQQFFRKQRWRKNREYCLLPTFPKCQWNTSQHNSLSQVLVEKARAYSGSRGLFQSC